MLPAISKTYQQLAHGHAKSFAETLTEGYCFELKNTRNKLGTRFVYYDQVEHTLIISHVESSRVHLLNLRTGELTWFDNHISTVRSVQVNNNRKIVTASWDGTCCVTDFHNLKHRLVLTEKEMGRSPYIAVSNENNCVYSYSYDSDKDPNRKSNTVRQWNLANGKLEKSYILPGCHLTGRRCGSVEVYNNKMYVVSDTGHLHIFNQSTGQLLVEKFFNDLLQSLCIIPSLGLVAFGGDNGNIYITDLNGRNVTTQLKAHTYYVAQLFIYPEKPDILISVSHDGAMKLWKLPQTKRIWQLPKLTLLGTVQVQRESLWSATVANDLLIGGCDNGNIIIYNIKDLTDVVLKGKLVLTNESYAFLPSDSNTFYASDIAMIQVRKKEDGVLVNSQFSDYLLKTTSNIKVFIDLFATENQKNLLNHSNEFKGYLQLTK